MTKLIPLSRAAATAAAAAGACLLALACPAAAAAPGSGHADGSGENTPLNLGSLGTGSAHVERLRGASIVRTIVGLAIVIARDLGAVVDPAPGQGGPRPAARRARA